MKTQYQYFYVKGETHREALDKIKSTYGSNAKILSHKTVSAGGIKGLFGKDAIEYTGYIEVGEGAETREELDEIAKKEILEKHQKGELEEVTLQELLDEVRSLKETLGSQRQEGKSEGGGDPLGVKFIRSVLEENDFTPSYIERIIQQMRRSFSLSELEDRDFLQQEVARWIAEGLVIENKVEKSETPHIIVLVGPTGVGKTTTIAKLAARFGLAVDPPRPDKVRIVTIDSYRIGAKIQIEKYGEIMGISSEAAQTRKELETIIKRNKDAETILIDTIGKGPKDNVKLAEMKNILDACGPKATVYLGVSATTKTMDVKEIMTQFEPFNYGGVVITKLDETTRIGGILSVLSERRKPIAYVTDGQGVPHHIWKASVDKLLNQVVGLNFDRDQLDESAMGHMVRIERNS